jgi:hypothetical protein
MTDSAAKVNPDSRGSAARGTGEKICSFPIFL